MVLVGPSGCGKSTTLRMIAGLEDIGAGTISIGGRVVNELQPKDRDIAMVFQSYALYPHMDVAKNMGFSLALRKSPSGKIAGQEIRCLRKALPQELPLIVSGRAVNLLAKPIENVQVAADFNSVMSTLRARGILPAAPLTRVPDLPDASQSA